MSNQNLTLAFHGRIIDHLGIQMYQSPTAAIAEIVSNAWDADAENVRIAFDFNSSQKSDWKITVSDDGRGMSFGDCQERFLSVGYNRRANNPSEKSPGLLRPVMGRKGIGKFAGFGIARYIKVTTVGGTPKQRTEFELDLHKIRTGGSYVATDALQIVASTQLATVRETSGTTIELRDLSIALRISEPRFMTSLSRRFSINSTSDQFAIFLNGKAIQNEAVSGDCEMSFPRDLPDTDKATRKLVIADDGWGREPLPSGRLVEWRIQFFESLIKDEELQGVTVFAHKKLAQRPFLFNLTGGLASQAGPEYMSGQVRADWVDELGEDVISTERQRLNWQHGELQEFQEWGQALIRRLMSVWKDKRSEHKFALLHEKVGAFAERLNKLGADASVVRGALKKLASIEKLNSEQFQDMGSAILLAWEGGRLRALIGQIAHTAELDESALLGILSEANAITALHTAETVRAKLDAIKGLELRIQNKELENAVRDYIASNPWLISPRWETFAVERRATKICSDAADVAYKGTDDFRGRVDLVLSSGRQLLLLEFMRPGLTLDLDHLQRFRSYCSIVTEEMGTNSALELDQISGFLVADKAGKQKGFKSTIESMRSDDQYAMSWETLLQMAKHQWREFLDHVRERAPDDARVQALAASSEPVALPPIEGAG